MHHHPSRLIVPTWSGLASLPATLRLVTLIDVRGLSRSSVS
jgi:hypothetical protein